ncbi:Chloroperoxidase [Mycena floridula]|nr:Chloroperoxidase [Mycena floridula]
MSGLLVLSIPPISSNNMRLFSIIILVLAPATALGSFAPGPEDLRSPCPTLNTPANHGFLPRDGKSISATHFHDAIQAGYNVSDEILAALIGGGVECCTSVNSTTIDLNNLALHDAIEHDASLIHGNADGAIYALIKVNQAISISSASSESLPLSNDVGAEFYNNPLQYAAKWDHHAVDPIEPLAGLEFHHHSF